VGLAASCLYGINHIPPQRLPVFPPVGGIFVKKRLDDAEYVIFELDHLAATLPSAERIALQRRVAQLSMDHIYNVIMNTHSEKLLDEYLDRLRKRGLFPLPDRDYTIKYSYFRKMINTKLGKKILLRTLPLMKKEK